MRYTRIAGTGSYLPEHVITNADIEKLVDTSNEWIVERTGIHSRHKVAPGERSSDMALIAAERAIEAAGIDRHSIQLILVATSTPDMILPNCACLVQERLGIAGMPAFDLVAACAGFIYGLSVADQFIRSGMYDNVLLIGTEALTSLTDWTDRETCVLFGDGAGAVVLQASDKPGVLSTHLHADGRYKDLLRASSPLPTQADPEDPPYVRMAGREVFKFAVGALGDVVDEALAHNGLNYSDIDWLVPHQANSRIISALAKKLDLPMERVIMTIADQGNTSAASVPLALDIAVRDGRIQRGERLLLEAIGGGFCWGSALIVY